MLRLCNADVSVNTSFLAMCLFLLAAKTTLSCSSTHLPPIHGMCHPESSANVAAVHSCARPLWLWYTIVRRVDITQARQQPGICLSTPPSPYAPPGDYRTLLAIAVALLMVCPRSDCATLARVCRAPSAETPHGRVSGPTFARPDMHRRGSAFFTALLVQPRACPD